jgi:hypothetical protein
MNIAQLLIDGSAQGQPLAHTKGAGLGEAASDFETLLANMISDALNGREGEGLDKAPAALEKIPFNMIAHPKMGKEQLLALIQEKSDEFTMLGEHLQVLLSSLLNGSATEPQVENFFSALSETMSRLGQSPEESKGKHFVLNALLGLKEMAQGGTLKGEVEKLAEGLPESLKITLKLHLNDMGRAASLEDTERDTLRFKLIAHMMSNAMGRAGETPASGLAVSATSGANGAINAHTHMAAAVGVIDTVVVPKPVTEGENQAAIETTGGEQAAGCENQAAVETAGGLVGADEGLPVDGPETATASDRVTGGPQSAFEDLLTADVEDIKPAVAESSHGREAAKVDNGGDTAALADDAVSIKVAGSEIEEGRAEADTSRDQKAETRVHTADASAERGAGASRKDFAQHISTHAESAKANAADLYGVTKQVADRFVEKFDILLSGNRSEARIQLHPRHLGELKIHLFVEHGSMRALLDASSHQVKEILEANLQSLKQSLENQGIQVSRFDVSVGQQGERGQGFSRNRFGRPSARGLENITQEAQRIKASLRIDGNLAVDVLV